jgi:two-component system, NtrC family, sensor kinase
MTRRKRVVIVDGDDEVREALRAMGYEVAALPSIAAGLAHELNNPLSVIVNNATTLGEDLAALRNQLEPDSRLRGELDLMAEAQADVAAAALRIQAMVADLRVTD